MIPTVCIAHFVRHKPLREKTHSYTGQTKPPSFFSPISPSSSCLQPKPFFCEVPAGRVTFIPIFDLSWLRHSDGHVLKVSEIQTIHLFKWVTGTQLHSHQALKDMVTSVWQRRARNFFPFLRYTLLATRLLLSMWQTTDLTMHYNSLTTSFIKIIMLMNELALHLSVVAEAWHTRLISLGCFTTSTSATSHKCASTLLHKANNTHFIFILFQQNKYYLLIKLSTGLTCLRAQPHRLPCQKLLFKTQ